MARERSFDGDGFYSALDGARVTRDMNWKAVAAETGVSASTLTRMRQGRRPDVDSFAKLSTWANLDPEDFFLGQDEAAGTLEQALPQISVLLRRDPHLSEEAAKALDELVKATYERLRKRD